MKAKPLSLEEKRRRTCDFFMEKKDFFQLKDLEKMLPKEKGIVQQTVKDVVQSLVSDRLVNCEKIGTSNYFWSFPSTAAQTRKVKIEALQGELQKLIQGQAEMQRQVEEAAASRQEGGGERETLLKELSELERVNDEYNVELEQFKEMDPDLFEQKKRQLGEIKEAVDRWTDNIFTLQGYCGNNFSISRADFAIQFGVPEDFDYVE